MALLDKWPPEMLEELLDSIVNKAILMAAIHEPGRRYGDPHRQFYAGPPLDMEFQEEHARYVTAWAETQIVTVNINNQTVEGSPEAIRNMARQESMQKHIAREMRDRSEELARALFMGAAPSLGARDKIGRRYE